MKKTYILLFILIGIFLFLPKDVQAEQFYEGAYINGMYANKQQGNHWNYEHMKFLQRQSDGQFAYCIEPYHSLNTNEWYTSTIDPTTISKEKWEKISLIAYYGYNYQNHNTEKWYAITQLMIWREMDPTSDFYFTNGLNGSRINWYDNEIQEIQNLVAQHNQKPSMHQKQYKTVVNQTIHLTDTNNVLKNYQPINFYDEITWNENQMTLQFKEPKKIDLTLEKHSNSHTTPPIFYYHPTSQKLMTVGNYTPVQTNFSIEAIETELILHKIDADTRTEEPQGEASLTNAVFELYNDQNELVETIHFDQTTKKLKNLNFGFYYLKEKEAGYGYTLNSGVYSFTLNEETPTITIELENRVIEQKIRLHKKYGTLTEQLPEEGISFEVYNNKNECIMTVTTDELGFVELKLPFGTYRFHQKNTTPGYELIEDFEVIIDQSTQCQEFELVNLEIEVPNTGKQTLSIFKKEYYDDKKKYLII